ncbi:MAG: S-layer homology domain-containing protein [Clostridia bacterium]|nr:S-layer homology domain-containing protein [Clostridia bacterium]
MKKLISIILALQLVVPLVAYAGPSTEDIARVQALGIIEGDDGGMRLDDSITRAEFAAIICRMAGIPNPSGMNIAFADVPSDHWAKDYISVAVSLGIVNGVGDGNFAPDANITYAEAMKMLVCLLGYGSVAESKGGWPNGYIAQAGSLGILKYADTSTELAVRGEIIAMIGAALDVKIMEPDYGTVGDYLVSSNTIAANLENNLEAERFEGIFEENAYVSIINTTPITDDGYITVGGVTMRSSSDYSELIGAYVYGWVRENANGKLEVVSLNADENETNITTLDAEDTELTSTAAIYTDENDKEKKINISPLASYAYNGRLTTDETPYVSITDGTFTLIDNNGDKAADIIMITEFESFVIDKLNAVNSSVYFADEKLFRGKRGFGLSADDESQKIKLIDKDGNTMDFAEVEIGDAITLSVSEDLKYVTAAISKDRVTGIIEEVDSNGKAFVGGNWYKTDHSVKLGDNGEFILDYKDTIVGITGIIKSDMQYGYIANAAFSGGIDSVLKLLVIEGLTPEKEVKEKAGTTTISYYLQNDSEKQYVCRSKIRYCADDTSGTTTSIESSSLNPVSIIGKAVAFSVDAEGKIDTLMVFSVPTGFSSCELNGDLFSFGGESVERGFCTDEETKIICIPSTIRSMEDFGVRVKITDGSGYAVYGVTSYSEHSAGSDKFNREPVDILLIKADMDASQPYPVLSDSDICIVGESTGTIDVDGNEVRKLEMLNGTEVITKITSPDSVAFGIAKTLRMGDLIQYVTDADGNIANIKKLASVQGLGSYISSGNLYGVAYDITYNTYDHMSNEMTDLIEISFENGLDNKFIKFFTTKDGQKIYLYDRKRGYIDTATTDDIQTIQQSGSGASKLFVLTESNDALALVIIND